MKGKVKFYNGEKSFGFIIPEDGTKDIYFQGRNCSTEFLKDNAREGQLVEYEIIQGPKGPEAIGIISIIIFLEGKVKFFDQERRFGMITWSNKEEIYFNGDGCTLLMPLEATIAGLKVRFQTKESRKGLVAQYVEPVARAEYEFDGRLNENFIRYAQKHKHALESWAEIPLNSRGIALFLPELAKLALKETWSFQRESENQAPNFDILWNYIGNTFLRLLRQGKISTSSKDGRNFALFNTGLVNEMYEPIYMLFKQTGRPIDRPWELMNIAIAGVDKEGKMMTSIFNPLPEPATYFERTEDMLLDTQQEIHFGNEHVILDGVQEGRYPYEWLAKNVPNKFEWQDYRLMNPKQRNRFLFSLREAIELDKETLYDMFERLKSAKNLAIKRVSWNYKTAIPQYYPLLDELSFLIPLSLVKRTAVDIALVVTRNRDSGSYEGRTVFPLQWAYMNARLVCRPDSDWLTTDISAEEDSALEEHD